MTTVVKHYSKIKSEIHKIEDSIKIGLKSPEIDKPKNIQLVVTAIMDINIKYKRLLFCLNDHKDDWVNNFGDEVTQKIIREIIDGIKKYTDLTNELSQKHGDSKEPTPSNS